MRRMAINDSWRCLPLPDGDVQNLPSFYASALSLSGSTVSLPHVPVENGHSRRGRTVYQREIRPEMDWQKAFIEFEAVDQSCRVFAEDTEIGSHKGGYSRFRVRIPDEYLRKGSFLLTVETDSRLNEHINPHFGDFTVFGGIPRPVNLLLCGENHFDYMYWGTDGLILRSRVDAEGNGILTAEPHAVCTSPATVAIRVTDRYGQVAISGEADAGDTQELTIPDVQLWDGQRNPALYLVSAELRVNGSAVDAVSLRTGFRTIDADGNGLRLNGRKFFLRGVARHQDREGFMTAVPQDRIIEDFRLIGEIGANAVRLSHYQHPRAAYEQCDAQGLLCWAEIPMLKMTEDPGLQENAEQQLTELILQNIHHPSVWCWGIQNEIAMFRDAPFMHEKCRELNTLAKQLDPGRMTGCANLYPVPPESTLNAVTDIVGYNYYFGWYYGQFSDYGKALDAFHRSRPGVPVGITEYGADANIALHSTEPKVKDYSEEFQALYHEKVYPFLREREWMWGSYVWNMFDFSSDRRNEGGTQGINNKGLVSWDRKTRKDAFYYYKAQWSGEPFVHLCGKRYEKRAADRVVLKVYSNRPEAELIVNGIPAGIGQNDGNGVIIFPEVFLTPGENRITAAAGESADEMIIFRVDQEPESYRLPDAGDGNVTNWFLQAEMKENCFSVMDSAQTLLDSPQASEILREQVPKLYEALTGNVGIPLGLTLRSILSRDIRDPDKIGRINQALQEIHKNGSEGRRE